jgi:hypothetical protein
VKQKFKIVRQYDPKYQHFWYYGYKYVFFNLIPVYVDLSRDFDDIKATLIRCSKTYAKVTIEVFWSD